MANRPRRNELQTRKVNDLNREPEGQDSMAVTVAAIQRQMAEQHERITEQDERIAELEEEIRNLRQQLQEVENNSSRIKGESIRTVQEGIVPPVHQDNRQEPVYKRFCQMEPAEFVGSSDPLEAEEWLSSIETILEFMELNDREKVMCASYMLRNDARYWWESVKLRRNVHTMTWGEFVGEFNQKYYNQAAMRAKQNEFLNLKQGNMTVIEAVTKFERLARLCPSLAATEEERTRKMMDMFCPDIALAIESGGNPPISVSECVERALRVEYRLAQLKEERARKYEARKNQGKEEGGTRVQRFHHGFKLGNRKNMLNSHKRKRNPQEQGNQRNTHPKESYKSFPICTKCGKQHPGECKAGTLVCFQCGKEGHFAKNCFSKPNYGNQQGLTRVSTPKRPSINQGRLEAPEPNAKIYAYTKGDAEAGMST